MTCIGNMPAQRITQKIDILIILGVDEFIDEFLQPADRGMDQIEVQ